jgi:F-type H+-transporting ATPase subunit alpha
MSVAQMALSIYAVNNGYMDKVELKKITDFEAALQGFAHSSLQVAPRCINATPKFSKRTRRR